MKEQNYAMAWKFLVQETKKIIDPILRNVILGESRKRCEREWGFSPTDGTLYQGDTDMLDDWEKGFVNDINDTISYGFDVREDTHKKEIDKAQNNMQQFVASGGKLSDIPDNIRTPFIEKIYMDALLKECDGLCQAAQDLKDRATE